MPPKKLPSKLTAQGSTLNPPPTARSYRQSLRTPELPESDTIPPLWTPNATPTEVFPEWTDPATLPSEHWGTAEEPFEDPLTPDKLLVPMEAIGYKEEITWKRPCQFLPVIVDLPVVPAAPPPPVPEPKAAGKKGAAPAAKKGEPEPPKKPPPPKHAHRRWSPEQLDALQAWGREEERIEREQQNRERVYMGFEDAIAYIVNERPRDLLAEVDFDADDLVDDGEDEDEAITGDVDVSNATSPWGVVPPPRIEVAPNSVYKPEIPHGEIVHADMASYFRIVEQLYSSGEETASVVPNPAPFLWQAIYPQDSSGHPAYNAGGKYSVKLFVFGRWRRVDVDDKLPVDSEGNVIYLASSMKNEIWPSLLVKALYKSAEPGSRSGSLVDGMCQTMVQIMLALTSWKVSRWEPGISQSFSENIYHQLQQFVPRTQQAEQTDESNEVSLEADIAADGTAEVPPAVEEIDDTSETQSLSKPRAVICSAGQDRTADLIFGEAVLVPEKPDQSVDNLNKPSALMATHLAVDPNGSVILIEEKEKKKKSSRSSLPAIVTLNSIFSGYISIPAVDAGNIVYRMYPQKTLRYGYSVQVESDCKVSFQDAPTYWRSLSHLRVMECDGTYPVMLPGSWNILFKQSFELTPLTDENGEKFASPPELRIDLHLTEELLSNFTHISVVNDATAYTLIVDCAPGNFHAREGKWKLTLASDWDVAKPTTHQMKLTRFEGVYEPNKPLLCFRDVIMAPKQSIWTSFQLQLLQDGAVVTHLAAKLEVFDFGAEQNPKIARSSRGSSGIKWRVNCWSTEEVKLLDDNTKELQYDAIRASWAEKAVDRNTNGAVSRLLYLGKLDEAEARMKQDNMTDEQIAKVRGRFEWVQAVKSKEVGTGDEKLLSEDELNESRRLLLERIGVVEADKEQRRVARALAKEERAKELKDMVRSVIEKRGASLERQQELKRELAAVQTRSA
ncbi:calpain-like cysteine protease C2 [Phytophthora sojae]|uniref:Calpain-like cysteine protease C2 n=1 Tax=Phytophthora sojae (strain P6497) TaxID=1094619 RepID=G5AEU5_PHYSP|nr:calpain-like cysteine protease C2 [Phytophthora sojae]EGZ05735.1 calpain-like cysteine protease C2 [Phytophthora sojae]|eukprot:XP_009538596.1 calpain-like cysteine protease C2 [Phytophthora sojae]